MFRCSIQAWELGLRLFHLFFGRQRGRQWWDDPVLPPLHWPRRFHGLIPGRHEQGELRPVFPALF